MDDQRFPRAVSLACHDLRTPLATVYGFARTLARGDGLDERTLRFVGMIEAAAEQMTALLDQLGVLARIEAERYEPALVAADTLELATSEDERVETSGRGAEVQTDAPAVASALESLALAAARHGGVERVRWTVDGREFALAPVVPDAGEVVTADDLRDLGAYVAARVIERLGGAVALDGETLRVRL